MNFKTFGNIGAPTLLLIPGLGVSYEIFLPLIGLLDECRKVFPYGTRKQYLRDSPDHGFQEHESWTASDRPT